MSNEEEEKGNLAGNVEAFKIEKVSPIQSIVTSFDNNINVSEENNINLFDTPKKESYTIHISSSPEINRDTKELFQFCKQSTSSVLGSVKRKGKEFRNRHEWKRRKVGNQEKPKLKLQINSFSNGIALITSNPFESETPSLNTNQKIFKKNAKTFLNFSEVNESNLNASEFESVNVKQTFSYFDKTTLIHPSCSNSVSLEELNKNDVKIESFRSPLKKDDISIKVLDEHPEPDEVFEEKVKIDECNHSIGISNDEVISEIPNLVSGKFKSRIESYQNSMETKLNLNSNIIEMYNSPKKPIKTCETFQNSFLISSSYQSKEKKPHSFRNDSDFERIGVRIDLRNKNTSGLDNSSNANVQSVTISTENNSNDMFDSPLTYSHNLQDREQTSILESTESLRINPKMQPYEMPSKMNVEHRERIETNNVLPTKFVIKQLSPILTTFSESTAEDGFHSQANISSKHQNNLFLNEKFDNSKFSYWFQTASQLLLNPANCTKLASKEIGDIKINNCDSQPTSKVSTISSPKSLSPPKTFDSSLNKQNLILYDSPIKEQTDLGDIDLFPSPNNIHDLETIDSSQRVKHQSFKISQSKLTSGYESDNTEINYVCESSVSENINENVKGLSKKRFHAILKDLSEAFNNKEGSSTSNEENAGPEITNVLSSKLQPLNTPLNCNKDNYELMDQEDSIKMLGAENKLLGFESLYFERNTPQILPYSTPPKSSKNSYTLSSGNNMRLLNYQSEPLISESAQFVRIKQKIQPFETPSKLNVEDCEIVEMDNDVTLNNENELSLLESPPKVGVRIKPKIQPFETPLKMCVDLCERLKMNNDLTINDENEPSLLESPPKDGVRIKPKIQPFETPLKINVDHCERLKMDNDLTINNENEPSIVDSPPKFVCTKQKIQPFETPLKSSRNSVDIENISSPKGKTSNFEYGGIDNNSFSEICFRQTESQHFTYLEEQKESISKDKIKSKRKAKAGSLLQKAYNIATRIDTNLTLFDYELKTGLRPSSGRQVSAPLEIISRVVKDDSLYLNCISLSSTYLAARNLYDITSNIIIVANNMNKSKINSKFIVIHFPLEVFTNVELKTLFVLAGNQIESIPKVDYVENIQSTKTAQCNDIESFSCSLMRSLHSNVSNSILDAAVGQLLIPEIVLNLLVLHTFTDVTKSVFILLTDCEEQFSVATFSGEAQLQYINLLINKNKIKQGRFVTFKGFCVTNMINIDERLKSLLEYCCGKIVKVSCLFSLKPLQKDWSIFCINKEFEMLKESITIEQLINENIQQKRYNVNNVFLEILEDCIFISDSPTGIKIKILFEDDIKLNQVPKGLDGVFLNNNCVVADKYTRINYNC